MHNKCNFRNSFKIFCLLPVLLTGKLHWLVVYAAVHTREVVVCDERVVCVNDFSI